jgi:hypothetical protein
MNLVRNSNSGVSSFREEKQMPNQATNQGSNSNSGFQPGGQVGLMVTSRVASRQSLRRQMSGKPRRRELRCWVAIAPARPLIGGQRPAF